jgi:hypothetical protein
MDHGTMTGSWSMVGSRPLQGSGDRRDSLGEREREEFVGVLTNDASWR